MYNQLDLEIALDANAFTRFAAVLPEEDTKRARMTVGEAEDIFGDECRREFYATHQGDNETEDDHYFGVKE